MEKNDKLKGEWEKEFYSILEDFKFVPGGRIMHGAGREDITTTLNNCYVVSIRKDSIKSIYDTIINEALTYKYGGGCGHDLSILRPSGKEINGTGGESCGPVGFMNLFSENTNTIAQHGRRGGRGAPRLARVQAGSRRGGAVRMKRAKRNYGTLAKRASGRRVSASA